MSDRLIHYNNSTSRVLPIPLPLDLLVFRTMTVSFGVPIQLLVAIVILRNKQLHNPRNIFWLGNITCHFANHLMGAYQYLVKIVPTISRTEIFCEIHSLLVGSPYTSLLVSLLLATADRWFAISDPIKHRKYVTVSGVAGCLIISWILVFFILTSPYWSGRVQLLTWCSGVNPEVMKWVALSDVILVVLIIVTQIAVYVRTRRYLRFRAQHQQHQPDEYFVHLPDKTICRLELEASVTLFCGVASLCVCTLPMGLVFLYLIVSKIGMEQLQSNESTVLLFIPYAREMLLLHSVVSPLLYILRSREFSTALRRTLPFCFNSHQRDLDVFLN